MSLKTILTMFILGSSSVALAQPMVRDHRDSNHDTITISGGFDASVGFATSPSYDARLAAYHDGYTSPDRHDDSRWNRGRWNRGSDRYDRYSRFGTREVLLAPASQMSLSNDGNAYHAVDARLGRLMSIELDGLTGVQYIDYVVLQLADGTNQRIEVDRRLNERNQRLTIDLGRRGLSLRGIGVFGSSPTRTALQITGLVR